MISILSKFAIPDEPEWASSYLNFAQTLGRRFGVEFLTGMRRTAAEGRLAVYSAVSGGLKSRASPSTGRRLNRKANVF